MHITRIHCTCMGPAHSLASFNKASKRFISTVTTKVTNRKFANALLAPPDNGSIAIKSSFKVKLEKFRENTGISAGVGSPCNKPRILHSYSPRSSSGGSWLRLKLRRTRREAHADSRKWSVYRENFKLLVALLGRSQPPSPLSR